MWYAAHYAQRIGVELHEPSAREREGGNTLGDAVGINLGDAVGDTLGDSLRDAVGDSLRDAVGDTLGDAVGDTLGDTLGGYGSAHSQSLPKFAPLPIWQT